MKTNLTDQYQGYHIRLVRLDDLDNYYQDNFPLDPVIAKLTGSSVHFDKQKVGDFLAYSVDSDEHFCFVMTDNTGKIIGESVINEVDYRNQKANFRIVIFDPNHHGKGLGKWATYHACRYAFDILKLNRLELSVFDFNHTAQACYQKIGFQPEGVMRQTLWLEDEQRFADEILMSLLKDEWLK